MKHIGAIRTLFIASCALASVSTRMCLTAEEQPLPATYNVTISFQPDADVAHKIVVSMPHPDDKPFVDFFSKDPTFVRLMNQAYRRVEELKPSIDQDRERWNKAKTKRTHIEMQILSNSSKK